MIKVVIIDDDIEMLIGLKKIINWETYGFTVIGEADNGEKGLDLIKEFMPEVVITDITMPGINGLLLIEKAQILVPNIKPIILTCHESFNYAKQALRLKACDYVLKYTLTKEILVDMIINLREKIEYENSINTKISAIDEELNINKNILKQKILKDLINCKDIDKDILKISKEAEALDIRLPNKAYILTNIFIDNFDISIEVAKISNQLLAFAMEKIFHEVNEDNKKYSYFDFNMSTKCILFWGDRAVKKDNSFNFKLQQYQKCINENFNLKISICTSSIYTDIFKINEAFKECQELRTEYFYIGSLGIVRCKKEKWIGYNNLYSKYKDEWIEVLLTYSSEKIINFTLKLSNEIKNSNYAPGIVKVLFNNLIIDIKSLANKKSIEIDCNTGFDTMDACVQSLERVINIYSKGLQEVLDKNFGTEIKKVLKYIDENLNEHITCDKMSDYIKMNTSYFSRLFKKEIGMSFSDYVIKQKIEKATYFLKYSGLSVEEIAFSTGFSNVCYFYNSYKKVTGKTPGEVRIV
ncbi:MAG: response regulator [Clostridiaceae bacterium]|nr:response regulator [Clostridiaceae bacterium]